MISLQQAEQQGGFSLVHKSKFSLVHKSNLAAQLFAPSASHQPATWAQRRPWQCSFGSSWHCWNIILDFQQNFLKWTSLEACTCLWWSRCLDHNTLGSQQPGVPTTAVDRERFVCSRLMSSRVSFLVPRLVLWFLPFANWLIFKLICRFHTHKNEWEFHSDLQADITGKEGVTMRSQRDQITRLPCFLAFAFLCTIGPPDHRFIHTQ